jgi:hypothetical protein
MLGMRQADGLSGGGDVGRVRWSSEGCAGSICGLGVGSRVAWGGNGGSSPGSRTLLWGGAIIYKC